MEKEIFETEFGSDTTEEMMDNIIASIGEQIEIEESKAAMLVPLKIKQMQFAYSVLKFLLKNQKTKISYVLNEPFKSMGSIYVEGAKFEFSNAEWFSRAVEFSSNMDIYPLTNGKVNMTLTFHGITKPIE